MASALIPLLFFQPGHIHPSETLEWFRKTWNLSSFVHLFLVTPYSWLYPQKSLLTVLWDARD